MCIRRIKEKQHTKDGNHEKEKVKSRKNGKREQKKPACFQ
jgi:hypothetical protein